MERFYGAISANSIRPVIPRTNKTEKTYIGTMSLEGLFFSLPEDRDMQRSDFQKYETAIVVNFGALVRYISCPMNYLQSVAAA